MDSIMIILMAVFFLWAGVVCLHRPRQVVHFVVGFFARASGNPGLLAAWGQSSALILIVRLFGVLSLINFILQLYLLSAPAVM